MRINAQMIQQEFIKPQACTIDDIVDLPTPEYISLMENLMQAKECFIKRLNANPWQGEYKRCLLVLGIGREDGILVDPQGSPYPKRVSFIPNARTILSNHIKQLADYAVSEGTEHSEDARWETSYEELYNHFGANITKDNGNCKMLVKELQRRKEIDELTVTEDGIGVVYKPEYCKNLQDGEKQIPARKLYVAYGSGLNMGLMKIRCPNAELVGRGEINGYELQFKGQQATVSPKENSAVPVAIWKVPPSDIEKFTSWIKHGGNKKQNFQVVLDNGQTINAIGYASDYDYYFTLPQKNLYQEIYQGYLDHGFDVGGLQKALNDCTQNIYAKERGGRIEHRTPYEERQESVVVEDECTEAQLIGMGM